MIACGISMLLSLTCLCIFFALRGIYPFGENGLEYMDNGQLVYPTLRYYISALSSSWGDGAFFINLHEGAGVRLAASLPHQLLMPSTWVALILGEEFFLHDMVWVMMVSVLCSCLTMWGFLRGVFPRLSLNWSVVLSVGYVVGGFIQTKYGFMPFLDHAAIFPLFAWGLYRLLKGASPWLYVLGVFLLATSMYSAFMAVIMGWVFAWFYTKAEKIEKRNEVLGRLFWTTFCVFVFTIYHWLPMWFMNEGSLRAEMVYEPTMVEFLWPFDPPNLLERVVACLPSLGITYIFWRVYADKQWWGALSKVEKRLWGAMLLLSICPAFIEPIHRAAHLWSYIDFAVRYGFIPNLLVIACAAYLLCKKPAEAPLSYKGVLVLVMLCSIVGFVGFWKPGTMEKSALQCENASWLSSVMDDKAGVMRIKDKDQLMMANSGCLGNIPTVSNFRHTTGRTHAEFFWHLGYRMDFTRTMGQGGTVFSDKLLGHGFVLSSVKDSSKEAVVKVEGTQDRSGRYVYRMDGADIKWARLLPTSVLHWKYEPGQSPFEYMNTLYALLYPQRKSPLYEKIYELNGEKSLMAEFPADECAIYAEVKGNFSHLTVNGREVPIMAECLGKSESQGWSYNGVFAIRERNDAQSVIVTAESNGMGAAPMSIYAVREYEEFPKQDGTVQINEAKGGRVNLNVTSNKSQVLMIPVVAENGWRVYVNHERAELKKVGELLAVEVPEGESHVIFQYMPPALLGCLKFSLVFGIFVLFYYVTCSCKMLLPMHRHLLLLGGKFFFVSTAVLVVAVYGLSLLTYVVYGLFG